MDEKKEPLDAEAFASALNDAVDARRDSEMVLCPRPECHSTRLVNMVVFGKIVSLYCELCDFEVWSSEGGSPEMAKKNSKKSEPMPEVLYVVLEEEEGDSWYTAYTEIDERMRGETVGIYTLSDTKKVKVTVELEE